MFYDKFKTLCAEKGIKPTPLIVGMGMSSSNVSQWKKGSTPRPEVLKKLADYFGVTVEYLLEEEAGEKEKPVPTDEDELGKMSGWKYYELSEENRALVDQMIEKLLKSQSDE